MIYHRINLKKTRSRIVRSAILATTGFLLSSLISLGFAGQASAANVTMSLVSSAANVQKGATFTVIVRLETGTATILDAYGRVNYNASQLALINTDYSQSTSWGQEGPDSDIGTGYYKFDIISQGTQPSGTINLARLTFEAKSDSGNSSLTIIDASVGDGTDPEKVHTTTVQGVSIGLQPAPASSSGGSVRSGAPTNAESNQGTPVTNEAALEEVKTENEQVAQTIDEAVAAEVIPPISESGRTKQAIAVGLGALILVGSGFVFWKVFQARRFAANSENGVKGMTDNSQNKTTSDYLAVKPNTPAAGSITEPDNKNSDS